MRLFLTFFALCSAITQSTSAIGDDNECKDSDSNDAKRRCEINCISEDIKGVIACKESCIFGAEDYYECLESCEADFESCQRNCPCVPDGPCPGGCDENCQSKFCKKPKECESPQNDADLKRCMKTVADTTVQCFEDNDCSNALTGLECYDRCLDAHYTDPANQCLCEAGCETAKDFECIRTLKPKKVLGGVTCQSREDNQPIEDRIVVVNNPNGNATFGDAEEISQKSVPWNVRIEFTADGSSFCSGSILTENPSGEKDYILTADHCCDSMKDFLKLGQPTKIIACDANREAQDETNEFSVEAGESFTIQENGKVGDSCLIEVPNLSDAAEQSPYYDSTMEKCFQPICLASEPPKLGTMCHIAGWGVTDTQTRETSDNLLGAHVNITQCSNDIKIAVPAFSDGQYFCAGSSPGVEDSMRVDSCQGDSGGAIVCMEEIEYEGKAKNIPVQYGLVSSGKSCGESAGVYAKTSTIVNTILKKIYTNTYAPEMDPRGVIPTMDEDEDSDYSYYGY